VIADGRPDPKPAQVARATAETYAGRRARLRSVLADRGATALLVTSPVNIRYLSGFSGSNGALLVVVDESESGGADPPDVLATDDRYALRAATEAPGIALEITRQLVERLVDVAADRSAGPLGFEEQHLTVVRHDALRELVGARPLVPSGGAVESLRVVKDEIEIDLLREACAIGDRALADVVPYITVGRTERQVARDLEAAMVAHGADAKGFDTIAAAGPHSAIPHHEPTDRAIEAGDLLKLDFGARFGGYHADMTRTFVVGRDPAPWQQEVYDLVRTAQRAGRRALAPGAELSAVDAAARDIIVEAGHGDHFRHGLGHGVGLQIHEDPFFTGNGVGRLAVGTPVTVEPGVYLSGRGGVRIEDTLVVRADGPELLTMTTKELRVLA
jgi:Xaa-Pro aminopeptidase